MSLINLGSEKDFQKIVENKELVLVDFFAPWCGSCQMLNPVLDDLGKEADYSILKINVDDFSEISGAFGISSIPTMIMFKDGKPVEKHTGYLPKKPLEEWFQKNH